MGTQLSRHVPDECSICRHVNGKNFNYEEYQLFNTRESGLNGCPLATILRLAITQERQFPADFQRDTYYHVTAGGNNPILIRPNLELFGPSKLTDGLQIGHLLPVSKTPDSHQCLNIISSWIQYCDERHKGTACRPAENTSLPRRVLCLGKSKHCVRLLETNGENERYVALSHRWGKQQICVTTKYNVAMRRDGIPWDAMPKTFQDAITVCQRLGVYYLWIDSLCIVQDDEQDWRVESAAMASIYENSYFTITAATAWTDEEGFLKERPKCHLSCDVIMGISCRERIRHESNNDWEPIWSRAWCFQERLVPRRLLTFRHSEVTWECRSASWCECGRNETYDNCPDRRTYERNIMNPFVSHSHRIEYWYTSIVEQFTTMSLSFEKDRLPAILAMATQILDRSEDRCLAGIWEADMLPGLLWRCFGRTGIDSIGNETIFFPMSKIGTELQTPSWSWASVEGPITYSLIRESSQRTFDAEILAVDYPKVYNDSRYIIGSSCSLLLRGRLMTVMLDLPDRLLLRGSSTAIQPHCRLQFSLFGDTPQVESSIAIPMYDVFYRGHHPIQPGCHCGLNHETVVFWPDAQLTLAQGHGAKKYLEKRVWPTESVTPGRFEVQCILLYTDSQGCWGGILVQRSRQNEGSYERLGLVEFYSTHPAFDSIADIEIDEMYLI